MNNTKEQEAYLIKIAKRVCDWIGTDTTKEEIANLVMSELLNYKTPKNIGIKETKTSTTKLAVKMLKGILSWSDRIGSDETYEIGQIIKLLTN